MLRRPLLIAFLAATVLFLLDFLPDYHIHERHLLDLAFRLRGAEKPHGDIVIVEIDDRALQAVGAWPWPRSLHAAVLKIVAGLGARTVFYDMVFPEVSTEQEDRAFAEELARAGNVVLPFYFAAPSAGEYSWKNAVFPIEPFQKGAARSGYVNATPDSDGRMREIQLTVRDGDQLFEHASLAIARKHLGESLAARAPRNLLINFPGPHEGFQRLPVTALLVPPESPAHERALASLAGKVVLIGLTAPGAGMDHKATAFSALYPGVGVQASVVHTLLSGKFIRRLPRALHWLLLFAFALLILWLSSRPRLVWSTVYALAASAGLFAVSQLAFRFFLLWMPTLALMVSGLVLFLGCKMAEFIRVRFERELLARELALAATIQKSFLPATFPQIPGLSLAAVSHPARDVGGDLYDVLSLGHGKWALAVGDVSGKGVPAALFMARTVSELRREAADDPARVVSRLNDKIASDGTAGLFFTLLYLVVDPKSLKFSFANGGHEPLFLYRARLREVAVLKTKQGMPLGVMPEGSFDKIEERAGPGDVLLLVSDGVKEAMDSHKQMFGLERIRASLAACAAGEPRAILDHLLADIRSFVRSAPQHDDLTLLCAKFE